MIDDAPLNKVTEKRKRNQPHYKKLFKDTSRRFNIVWRCLIGIAIVAVASLILNFMLLIQLNR
jgi:hypothetical protein